MVRPSTGLVPILAPEVVVPVAEIPAIMFRRVVLELLAKGMLAGAVAQVLLQQAAEAVGPVQLAKMPQLRAAVLAVQGQRLLLLGRQFHTQAAGAVHPHLGGPISAVLAALVAAALVAGQTRQGQTVLQTLAAAAAVVVMMAFL